MKGPIAVAVSAIGIAVTDYLARRNDPVAPAPSTWPVHPPEGDLVEPVPWELMLSERE